MSSASNLFELALQRHRSGNLAEAEKLYRQILTAHPNDAGALHMLGVLAYDCGQFAGAVELLKRAVSVRATAESWTMLGMALRAIRRPDDALRCYDEAIRLRPDSVQAHTNRGNALMDLGRVEDSIAAQREALRLSPGIGEVWIALGNALLAGGRAKDAIEAFRRATEIRPENPASFYNLGVALAAAGQFADAESAYRRAIELRPKYPEAHNNLGLVLRETKRAQDAIAAFREAIEANPNIARPYVNLAQTLTETESDQAEVERLLGRAIALDSKLPEAHHNLANLYYKTGRLAEAVNEYSMAIALNPRADDSLRSLGNTLMLLARVPEARQCFEAALRLNSNDAAAWADLGAALRVMGEMQEAENACRRSLELNPDKGEAHNILGIVLQEQGRNDEALQTFRTAVDKGFWQAGSNMLMMMHVSPKFDAQTLFEEHRTWGAAREAEITPVGSHDNDRSANRRLKIGYVSADFRQHSVAYFFEPILANRNRENFEIFCYSGVTAPDAITQRIREKADHWRDTVEVPDERVASMIVQDRIDLLIDLAGHTSANRLTVFARRPAPVQTTYIGYPDTTGLTRMDYRITDANCDPPGATDALHTEKLVRLSPCFLCYQPPRNAPGVARPPSLKNGFLTFGCFGFSKATDPIMRLWARIMEAVPNARLILKNRGLCDPAVSDRVRKRMIDNGLAAQRVEFLDHEPDQFKHLELYGRIDVALDTFPYSGTTTTCEALYMGVPVVTLAGKTHASRTGLTLLKTVGLSNLVADSDDDYVRIATELASHAADIRKMLREQVLNSPLCDALSFASKLEEAYRRMWKVWCTG